MSTVATEFHPNNARLRELIEAAGLTQRQALALFNAGLLKPYSESAWKAFLADPAAVRFRAFDDVLLRHAEKALARRSPRSKKKP